MGRNEAFAAWLYLKVPLFSDQGVLGREDGSKVEDPTLHKVAHLRMYG